MKKLLITLLVLMQLMVVNCGYMLTYKAETFNVESGFIIMMFPILTSFILIHTLLTDKEQ